MCSPNLMMNPAKLQCMLAQPYAEYNAEKYVQVRKKIVVHLLVRSAIVDTLDFSTGESAVADATSDIRHTPL
jgi:hypothetical protein